MDGRGEGPARTRARQHRARSRGLGAASAALALVVAGGAARAQESESPAESPPVALERLLHLPQSLDFAEERRGGATRGEWRARFEGVREELGEAEAGLAAAREKLGELASKTDSWQVGAPGLTPVEGAEQGPLNYGLREEMRRLREDVELAEQRLHELEVEANLAGVPEEWRS